MTSFDPVSSYEIAGVCDGQSGCGLSFQAGFNNPGYINIQDAVNNQNYQLSGFQWFFVPLPSGDFAIFMGGQVEPALFTGECLYALDPSSSAYSEYGPCLFLAAFSNDESQRFQLSQDDNGVLTFVSSLTGTAVTAVDMQGTDYGGGFGTWDNHMYVAMTSTDFGVGRPVTVTVSAASPQTRGSYPVARNAPQEPLPDLPTIKTINDSLPVRLPADQSDDPVYGEAVLPFFLVQGDMWVGDQLATNPYYLIRHCRYYKQLSYFQRSGGPFETQTLTNTTGMTTSENANMTATVGMTVMVDGGFNFGSLTSSMSSTFDESLSIETSTSSEEMITVEKQVFQQFNDGEGALVSYYGIVHTFELFRGDMTTSVARWEASNQRDVTEVALTVSNARKS